KQYRNPNVRNGGLRCLGFGILGFGFVWNFVFRIWNFAGGRRLAQRRHGDALGLDLHAGPHLRQPANEEPVVGLEALGDHAQAALWKRPGRDPAWLELVLGVEHVDELEPLLGADGPVDDEEGRVRLADRQADADEHPRRQEADAAYRQRILED